MRDFESLRPIYRSTAVNVKTASQSLEGGREYIKTGLSHSQNFSKICSLRSRVG